MSKYLSYFAIFIIAVFVILSVRAVHTLRMTVFFVVCSALMFAVVVFPFVVRVRTGLMLAVVQKATVFVVAGSALFSNMRFVRGNIGKTKRLCAKFQIFRRLSTATFLATRGKGKQD